MALASIGLTGFCIRFGLRAMRGSADFESNGYTFFLKLSRHLAEGAGYTRNGIDPTAFRVPFYPIFLALTGGEDGNVWFIVLAQSALSAGSVVLTGLVARRLFSEPVALLAAAIAMVWPYAVAHDTALQESGLFAFLTMLSLWLLLDLHQRGRGWTAIAVGVVLGVDRHLWLGHGCFLEPDKPQGLSRLHLYHLRRVRPLARTFVALAALASCPCASACAKGLAIFRAADGARR